MSALTAGSHDRMVAGAVAVRDKAPANVTTAPPPAKSGGIVKGAAEGAAAGATADGVGAIPGAVVGGAEGGAKKHQAKKAAKKAGGPAGSAGMTKWASKAGPGRKLLVAEFLTCIAILALSPLSDKHSGDTPAAFMKRGASICALFFILGLVSSGGKGACKVAAAFGGVVTLALLLSSKDEFAVLAARFNGGPGNTGGGQLGPDGTDDNQDVTPSALTANGGIVSTTGGGLGPNGTDSAAGAGGGLGPGGTDF